MAVSVVDDYMDIEGDFSGAIPTEVEYKRTMEIGAIQIIHEVYGDKISSLVTGFTHYSNSYYGRVVRATVRFPSGTFYFGVLSKGSISVAPDQLSLRIYYRYISGSVVKALWGYSFTNSNGIWGDYAFLTPSGFWTAYSYNSSLYSYATLIDKVVSFPSSVALPTPGNLAIDGCAIAPLPIDGHEHVFLTSISKEGFYLIEDSLYYVMSSRYTIKLD